MTGLPDWNDATRAQILSARPDMSTWLSANAGSGKTRVLTDRVARLLLDGVTPQHILCLTYTKAAASEMQNRLFKRLGAWAMMEDDDLRRELLHLGVLHEISNDELRRARTLFALAIETPGGLKIQTIHSFCAALLRRFPLEAGVSPQFTEVEDRDAELLRAEIMDEMAEGAEADLVDGLAKHYTGEEFARLTAAIVAQRAAFIGTSSPDLASLFELPPDLDASALPAQIMDQVVARWMPKAIEIIAHQKKATMKKLAVALSQIDFGAPTVADQLKLEEALLTKEGTIRSNTPTQDAAADLGPLLTPFEDLAVRVFDGRDRRLALAAVARSDALHQFAHTFVSHYEAKKLLRGWLDFDDLILRARTLLTDPKVAAWVLYRIDGGIDHILVDEAQDTAPRQWEVIERLAAEFTAGDGAHAPGERTLFVVGDKKQSIYSFQGADPREFDTKRDAFQRSIEAAQLPFQSQSLDYSFRSSPAVLRAVDATFNTEPEPRMDAPMQHLAFKDRLPGRVDVWPVIEADTKEEAPLWSDPIDRRSPRHHKVTLAKQIAAQIRFLIESGETIPDEDDDRKMIRRPIRPGDFLILVQGRGTGSSVSLFREIISACKEEGLAIAGTDRLRVGAELAVRDVLAVLSFLATPDDSLSLATALRSPLLGWSEQEVFTLAHDRGEATLWQVLRTWTDRAPKTVAILRDLRAQIDFLRPFDLIERLLTRHDGRQRLLARLSEEAEDGIDALLSQALSYEQTSIPSLTGFLEWMQSDDLEIKRQIDSASDQIRVMSVHGAKGLEAPIVILPDTAARPEPLRGELVSLGDVPIWKPSAAETPSNLQSRIDEIKETMRQERLRLLYVAMTRAEKWLIVCASGKLASDCSDWYQMIDSAMKHLGAVDFTQGHIDGKRHSEPGWEDLPLHDPRPRVRHAVELDPVYTRTPPPPVERAKAITPSDLGGAKALPGDNGRDEEAAKAFGSHVHLLLEHLPALPQDEREGAAHALLSQVDGALRRDAISEAFRVLETAHLASIFLPETLAEVAVTAMLDDAPLYGVIDRLVLDGDDVLAIDFKTNQTVPDTPKDCPLGLLRQMGAYAHALAAVYPGKRIRTAILWTRTAALMELPLDVVTTALREGRHLDAAGAAS